MMMETPHTTSPKGLHPVLEGVDKAGTERVQARGVVATRAREINLTPRENRGQLKTSSRKEYSGWRILAGTASM